MTIRLKDLKGLKGVDLQGRQKRGRFPVVEKSRRTMGGIVFDSAMEMRRYATLQLWERAGQISHLRRQPKFPVEIKGGHYVTYTADFIYQDAQGVEIIEECKSSGTRKDKEYLLRRKAAELYYGFRVKEFVAR